MVGHIAVGHSLGPHVLRAGAVIHDDAVVDVDGLLELDALYMIGALISMSEQK